MLQAHYADAVPIALMKREQQRLGGQIEAIDRKLRQLDTQFAEVQSNLDRVLTYLTDLADTYARSGPMVRRQINQALFSRIEVSDDGTITAVINEAYAAITNPRLRHAAIVYRQGIAEAVETVQNERRRRSAETTASVAHMRSFLTVARRAAGVKETHLAEGVVSEFRT